MKKLIVTSVAVILTMTAIQTQAQANEDLVKTEIKNTKSEEKTIKKEEKEERKTLRKLEGNEVSIIAKNNFISDFGKVSNLQWTRRVQFDEASFIKDGERMTAYYDYNSKLVGTTQNKSFSDIPANAQKKILEKYKGYSVGDVVFFDDNEANETDMVYDGIQFDDADSYFVELTNDTKKIVLMVGEGEDVSYFTTIK